MRFSNVTVKSFQVETKFAQILRLESSYFEFKRY